MPDPPFQGTLGESIHENICGDCWAEWTGEQTKFINEHHLNLGKPSSRQMLDAHLRAFLRLPAGR